MKFSIVIPTKNEEDYLPLLLASLKKQTLQPDELIIADNHSTDQTLAFAQAAGARIVDGGLPSVGRNRGAAQATGEVILFLDADVILHDPDFLRRGLAEFTRRNLGIATCNIRVEDASLYDRFSHQVYNVYVRLWGKFHPHAPGFCIFIRRSIHEQIGGFDEGIVFCEDHEYANRASKVGPFGLLNDIVITVTTRRQERDGRLSMAIKYILAEVHILFLGPIRDDRFKYGFGYDKKVTQKVLGE